MTRNRERLRGKNDMHYVTNTSKHVIKVKNKNTNQEFSIPRTLTSHSLRNATKLSKFNVTDNEDYVIVRYKDSLDNFLKQYDFIDEKGINKYNEIKTILSKNKWQDIIQKNSNLLLRYKTDISASGTVHIAYYSDNSMFPGSSFHRLYVENMEHAKILVMWFNSTFGIICYLAAAKPTRGAYLSCEKGKLEDIFIIDPSILSEKDKKSILDKFDYLSKSDFTSLKSQLQNNCQKRFDLDMVFARILYSKNKLNDKELQKKVSALQRSLYNKINELLDTM